MKQLLILFLLCLTGCAQRDFTDDAATTPTVCQGLGCASQPDGRHSTLDTYKPSKEERRRVSQGLPPEFGRDDTHVTFPLNF